jgi:hypothetical protein
LHPKWSANANDVKERGQYGQYGLTDDHRWRGQMGLDGFDRVQIPTLYPGCIRSWERRGNHGYEVYIPGNVMCKDNEKTTSALFEQV